MSARNFAFMSFLDLISCAFGAAILIFLLAVSSEEGARSPPAADVLLIRCLKQSGEPVEVHFIVHEPGGRIVRTAGDMPRGYARFISRTRDQAGSFLVIPQPPSGEWTVQAYWANESIKSESQSVARVEILCPRLKQADSNFVVGTFTPTQRYSDELTVEIIPP